MKDRQTISWLRLVLHIVLFGLSLWLACWAVKHNVTNAQPQPNELENALYQRAEFFGAQAIVPLPPSEARARVAVLQQRFPQDTAMLLKAAELDEQLGKNGEAEVQFKRYVELQRNAPAALDVLAEFYARRARFSEQAATLAKLLEADEPSNLAANLRDLLALARRHGLVNYLSVAFFNDTIARQLKNNPDNEAAVFTVISEYLSELQTQKRWAELAAAAQGYRQQLPAHDYEMLLVQVNALVKQNKYPEAEKIYDAAFDPFWPEEKANSFYWDFLSRHDHLRAYGQALRARFQQDPTNFQTALRWARYREAMDDRAAAARVFRQLEEARAERGQQWTDIELATVARLLIAHEDGEAAARYLYTLAQRGGLQAGNPLRAEVLYQLFRLLTEHANQRTPLTQGDLRFYADVASADPHPGMLGGVLSFVLSDTNPARRLDEAEGEATAKFNLATAFRLFEEYKQERPTSPQLAEMYCALIEEYANAKQAEPAAALLAELETRAPDAPQRAAVALRLADYYAAHQQREKELAIYRQLLAHFGAQFKQGKAKSLREMNEARPSNLLDAVAAAPLSYADVLHRYVGALKTDKRTSDIYALYADAIKAHPNEAWLYEEFLAWLESANLVNEQLAVYQGALQRFDSMLWTDRLARWFVRYERRQDFEKLSRAALAKFDETQTAQYLAQHLGNAAQANAKAFDAQLYRALYAQAHERFPHSATFVNGLLRYHEARKEWGEWQALLAEHYWEAREWREMYLRHLSQRGQLRGALDTARARVQQRPNETATRIYHLFFADAAAWLSHYEEAAQAYNALAQTYPSQTEFAERVVALSRSFGQREATALQTAAQMQQRLAEANPANAAYRTAAGELAAEQGDYQRAAQAWNQLLTLGAQDEQVWLETATVFWDYFQYDDALRVLRAWRQLRGDDRLYAFQVAAILDNQHQTTAALAEYVKALDPASPDHWRTRQRLQKLAQRTGVAAQIQTAWAREAARRVAPQREALTLGYVRLLVERERWPEAAQLLRRGMAANASADFLAQAQSYFNDHNDAAGEWLALQRLAQSAPTARLKISYRLRLAEHAARQKQAAGAARQLQQLVQSYPTNYGVICAASEMAWRIGARELAMRILQQAHGRARGRFRYQLARQMAANESARGGWRAAESILVRLHQEDERNLDVFAELARVSAHTSSSALLRERYRATIQALKDQDELDRYELRERIAEVRGQVIEAFTALRDYTSAVEQHIEIINRDPDDEEVLENALRYCQRYGGADELIAYYTRTAKESFKDYRWNYVLARLYAAKRDWPNAQTQFQQAIHNQPELLVLHEALGEAALQFKAYDEAIKARQRASELTNNAPAQQLKLIEAFERAGRTREAAALRAQLPKAAPRAQSVGEQFASAAQLGKSQRPEAIAQYRTAFKRFADDFYQHFISAADLQGYVEVLRDEESLDQIAQHIWEVRERLRVEATRSGNAKADQARKLLQQLDRSIPEIVGRVASERATSEELQGLRSRVNTWSQAQGTASERDERFAVLLNLCWRSGLGDAGEKLMLARKDEAYGLSHDGSLHHERLQRVLDFYAERGAYERALNLLVAESERDKFAGKFEYTRMIAEHARWLNDRSRELQALRQHFDAPANLSADSGLVERYLTLLRQGGDAERAELAKLVQQPGARHLQVLNFVLRQNDVALANTGIAAAQQNALWKHTRQAELSLVAQALAPEQEAHFIAALGWQPIGEMVRQVPDKSSVLQGDAWFALAASYGRWLALAEQANLVAQSPSAQFLPALLELRPTDLREQTRFAEWMLERNQPAEALDSLQLVIAQQPRNTAARLLAGKAYFKSNERQLAVLEWKKLLEEQRFDVWQSYARVMAEHGFATEARASLQPLVRAAITKRLSDDKELAALAPLVRQLAATFKPNEAAAQARYFNSLLVKSDRWLAELVITESLASKAELPQFYEWLIAQSVQRLEENWAYDALRREHANWSRAEVERAFEHQNELDKAETEDANDERLHWQHAYLDFLFAQRQFAPATQSVAQLEQAWPVSQPRPVWLRLAQARLALHAGNTATARAQLAQFIGLTQPSDHERMTQLKAPSATRLSLALQLLNETGNATLADELAQAAYARQLALGQVSNAPLQALAQLAWRRNDPAQAKQWLALLVKLGEDATRETAQAELAALPIIKAQTINAPWLEVPAERHEISLNEALRTAAESCARHAQYDEAIAYRQRLLERAPQDETLQLELARTYAAAKQPQAAGKALAGLAGNRQATRAARWQAVWLADELDAERGALWQAMNAQTQRYDGELQWAWQVLSSKQAANAPAGSATLHVWQGWRGGSEVVSFVTARVADANAEAAWLVPDARWALVKAYAKQQQAGAALRLSERDERLRPAASVLAATLLRESLSPLTAAPSVPGLVSLSERLEQARRNEREATLAALAQAAEQLGELERAVRYEAARLELIQDEKARAAALQHIEALQAKAAALTEQQAKQWRYAVSEQMLSLLYQ